QAISISSRIDNAVVSYVRYLSKMIWPQHLAVLYPYRDWPMGQVVAAAALLMAMSLFAWRQRARRPYMAFGWLWYLVTLVPVIGLAQVGIQSIADRYTYIPFIGLFIAVVWLVADWIAKVGIGSPRLVAARIAAVVVGVVAVLACAALTDRQLGYWENSVAL